MTVGDRVKIVNLDGLNFIHLPHEEYMGRVGVVEAEIKGRWEKKDIKHLAVKFNDGASLFFHEENLQTI